MDRLKLFVMAEAALLVALGATWILGRDPGPRSGDSVLQAQPSRVSPAELENPSSAGARVARSAQADESEPLREDIDPDLGAGVCGTVRGAAGQTLAGASVSFVRDGARCSTTSAENGVYAVTGLAAGPWELRVSADGHARLEEDREVAGRAWQTIDVELAAWYAVRVRFETKTGEPLGKGIEHLNHWAAPYVVATLEPLERDLPATENTRVHLFGVGRWEATNDLSEPARSEAARGGYAGELHLDREPPLYASVILRHLRLATQRIEIGQRELTFTVDPSDLEAKLGSVRIRIVDRDSGAPMSGVVVQIETAQGGGISGKTDESGRARFEKVMPGIGMVDISARDREMLWFHVRVPAGAELDVGDVMLSSKLVLRGRVLDERGAPAPGAFVRWDDLDRRTWPAPLCDRRSAGLDAEGRFEVRVGLQRYALSARDREGRRAFALFDARDGTAEEVVLRLQPSSYVRLRYDPIACGGYVLVVHAADDVPVDVVALDGSQAARGVDLPRGAYVAKIYDAADQIVKTLPFAVGNEIEELSLP